MYKLLIVDDEDLVRNAILKKLDWTFIGFDDIRQAEDGEQALEIALEFKPDVVLTDIRMPFIDGLELSQRLSEVLPDTKILLLSGHDEFKYAQEAVKIGVYDYILKPIHSVKLTELLKKVKTQLDIENSDRTKLTKLKTQLNQSLPLLKERFFNLLINNSINAMETKKQMEYLETNFQGDVFIVCVFEIDDLGLLTETNSSEDMALLSFSVSNIISELIGNNGVAFNDSSNRHIIIFSGDNADKQSMEADLYTILEQINSNITKYLKITITIGIGSFCSFLGKLHVSYKDALQALKCKIVMGKNKIFNIKDLGYQSSDLFMPVEKIDVLLAMLKLESPDKIEKNIDSFFEELAAEKNISSDNLKVILTELISGVHRTLIELKNETAGTIHLDFSIYHELNKLETLDDLRVIISHYIMSAYQYISNSRNIRNVNIIEKAKQYINENYFLEELSLNYIAGIVSVSPGYLSILFKKEAGENFIEYITKIRMEKAKIHLKTTNMKIYEIANAVGFVDPHYFCASFKKYTGLTTSEFKNGN